MFLETISRISATSTIIRPHYTKPLCVHESPLFVVVFIFEVWFIFVQPCCSPASLFINGVDHCVRHVFKCHLVLPLLYSVHCLYSYRCIITIEKCTWCHGLLMMKETCIQWTKQSKFSQLLFLCEDTLGYFFGDICKQTNMKKDKNKLKHDFHAI